MKIIGERIKNLRKIHKLTQDEFGDIFGIAKSTVSSYENGRSVPDDEIKIAICKHFNVSADYLLGLSDCPQNVKELGSKLKFTLTNEDGVVLEWLDSNNRLQYLKAAKDVLQVDINNIALDDDFFLIKLLIRVDELDVKYARRRGYFHQKTKLSTESEFTE